jgi:hypothetical protein
VGKARPARKADNLTAICEPIVQKMWEPQPFTPLWAFTACYRDSFTFLLTFTLYFAETNPFETTWQILFFFFRIICVINI